MNIQTYYKYSLFSSLAYVDWEDAAVGLNKNPALAAAQAIKDANKDERVPGNSTGTIDTLGEKIFLGSSAESVGRFQDMEA